MVQQQTIIQWTLWPKQQNVGNGENVDIMDECPVAWHHPLLSKGEIEEEQETAPDVQELMWCSQLDLSVITNLSEAAISAMLSSCWTYKISQDVPFRQVTV